MVVFAAMGCSNATESEQFPLPPEGSLGTSPPPITQALTNADITFPYYYSFASGWEDIKPVSGTDCTAAINSNTLTVNLGTPTTGWEVSSEWEDGGVDISPSDTKWFTIEAFTQADAAASSSNKVLVHTTTSGEKGSVYIYADRAVRITGTSSEGESVNLALKPGWNEAIWDNATGKFESGKTDSSFQWRLLTNY
jgi:hypothetical protein